MAGTSSTTGRMPAEWEEHEATWIAWPHEPTDWPGKLEPIQWVYAEITRALTLAERVEILCSTEQIAERARECLQLHRVDPARYRLHVVPTDRSWLRDSMPVTVKPASGGRQWVRWNFRAWAKYDNYGSDNKIADHVSKITGLSLVQGNIEDGKDPISLEGGAIEVDGEGTMLTTEECLLSPIQERNPGFGRAEYEAVFARHLGIKKTIWLGQGCEGDDTHGHIDDIARFVAPGKVVLAYEANPKDANHAASADNLERLRNATDARGKRLEVILLPMPRPIWFGEERLPASYANFYIANGHVLVPTFNDENDRAALNILADAFPGRKVIGIHAVDLVLGQGTLHCLTQQQPK
ncbi:MAG: agmatine deiminase family protein [Bdellovibrionota bacterium]